jgi:antirestriction protein ArdC
MTKAAISREEALTRARDGNATGNYHRIYEGFIEKGIPEDDILPRENVFTFNAWKALGRVVKKGEKGVKVTTWIPMTKKNDKGDKEEIGRKPRTTTVFHISQTKPLDN